MQNKNNHTNLVHCVLPLGTKKDEGSPADSAEIRQTNKTDTIPRHIIKTLLILSRVSPILNQGNNIGTNAFFLTDKGQTRAK